MSGENQSNGIYLQKQLFLLKGIDSGHRLRFTRLVSNNLHSLIQLHSVLY